MRREILLATALIFALSGSCRGQDLLPTEPQLVTHARRVISTARWTLPYYVWLTPTRLVAFEGAKGYEVQKHWWLSPVTAAIQVDTETSNTQPLPDFTKRWISQAYFLYNFNASPDGKWLLFQRKEGIAPDAPLLWVQTSLDANPLFEEQDWNLEFESGFVWTRDSTHWIALEEANGHMQCSVFNASAPQLPITIAYRQWATPKNYSHYELLGIRADGRLLALLDVAPPIPLPKFCPPIEFVDFSIEPNAAPPHHFIISPPKSVSVFEVVLSPDGSRLAWSVDQPDLIPQESGKRSKTEDIDQRLGIQEFWVSKVDGTGMKRLGWLLTHPYKFPYGEEAEALRWTPDSKRLSFIYQDAFYTIPLTEKPN